MSILMLATECDSTWIIANRLHERFGLQGILIEPPVDRKRFLSRRIRRLGYAKVAGQVAFRMLSPALAYESRSRRREILTRNRWDPHPPFEIPRRDVPSVNDERTFELLREWNPQVIVINGTRILSRRLLTTFDVPFLNMHAGITPRYRGVHGGYWAFARNDAEHAGVTVHRVDPGIDTGDVIFQSTIRRERSDNYATYPLLQMEAGMSLLESAVAQALDDEIQATRSTGQSELFHHPTLWEYLQTRWTQGIK